MTETLQAPTPTSSPQGDRIEVIGDRRLLSPGSWLRGRDRRPRVRGPLPLYVVVVVWSCLGLAALSVWALFYAFALSGLQAQRSQTQLYAQFREELSLATAPLGGAIAPGSPVAELDAPQVGIHQLVVVEGTASGQLQAGPGHRRDTPLPGQVGTSVLFGRSVMFGGPFGSVARLRPGQMLSVVTGQGTYLYTVEDVRRGGDRLPPPLSSDGSRLELVSSEGSGWQSGWAPTHLVYVDALLKGQAGPSPAGRPASVSVAELAMHADTGALVLVVLWMQLLVAAALAVVWLAMRWGRWHAWLVGVPVVLACLWGLTSTAVQLLPNLL
jgi:sortase A